MLRYLTSGESHGKCMLTILDGMPAGLLIDKRKIDDELSRRMFGYGRGKRMKIESDRVQIMSGLRRGLTIGSPIAMMVENVDRSIDKLPIIHDPRPGHADLAGALKYGFKDVRNVLERSSARDTVGRVSAGAIAKILLAEFDIRILSHVIVIGGIASDASGLGMNQIAAISERSSVRCADPEATRLMCEEIEHAMEAGDTLGGVFEIIIRGVPPGIGSYTQWDRRIDANLARAVMSIQAIKGVSFGIGFEAANRKGSMVHDEIFYDKKRGFYRKTNNAGGIEGGMTNGDDIVIQAVMKPLSTLRKPLSSVNVKTKRPVKAAVERSDVCAVPAAGVIGESVCAIEIANEMIEKFGGDSVQEMRRNNKGYIAQVKKF
ncbi:MAG: chorismate synthase [Candidatus Omnitrophica bacterium]|nr:chorismate synthase [Candidatus Omnitrophota bacterium]